MSTQQDRVLRVLLIEDDPVWQKLLRNLILQINRRVLIRTTTSGETAFEIIDDGQGFDLIVTDLSLEGTLNGLDVIQHCRDRGQLPKIAVISSHAFLDQVGAQLKNITPTVISKTAGVKSISDVLRSLL